MISFSDRTLGSSIQDGIKLIDRASMSTDACAPIMKGLREIDRNLACHSRLPRFVAGLA